MLGFLIGEALRDLRRAGRVAVSAILLITLSLAALGGFWLLSSNIGQATDHWRNRVRIIVFLKRDAAAPESTALVERVAGIPGVSAVRYFGQAETLSVIKHSPDQDARVADTR